ncbi:MAG: MBL fold metallo-hydrolase [Aeromicrobium erythreum]
MSLEQVADGVWHGTGTDVGWVLARDGSDLTLVDGGYPGDVDALEASIRAVGCRPEDVRAVLLTHAHVDHLGGPAELARRYGTPVLAHPDEVPLVRGERSEQASTADVVVRCWHPRVATWAVRIARAGGRSHPTVPDAQAWAGDRPLDLPGGPVPVPCVGHTSGHAAYHLPAAGVLVTGDAVVTAHPVTGRRGPHLLPDFFSTDPAMVRRTVCRLAEVPADVVVPGHGPVWHGSPADLVAALDA